MRPLAVSHVFVDHTPGRPSTAQVEFEGGIRLLGIQVWPARHGPLVLFPLGTDKNPSPLSLTPLLRSMVVQSVVAEWRRSRQIPSRAAA